MNAGPECFSGYFYSLASVPDDEWPAAGEPWCGVTATDFIEAPASYSGAFFVNDVAIAEPAAESEAYLPYACPREHFLDEAVWRRHAERRAKPLPKLLAVRRAWCEHNTTPL